MVLQIMQHIYETVRYAEINLKIDNCHVCGSFDEIPINENLEFECSHCGNDDFEKMSVVRRTCGLTLGPQ